MKKLTLRQTDKLFDGLACDVYDKFIENAIVAYSKLFPDRCDKKIFDHAMYDKVRERLMIELQVRYAEARGEVNVEKRLKKASAKRTVAK